MIEDKSFLFIVSSKAGFGRHSRLVRKIEQIYRRRGISADRLTIVETTYEGHVADLASEFAARMGERGVVYVCGGDGSACEAAHVLRGTGTYFGVIPLGTGNDFARTLYGKKLKRVRHLIERTPEPRLGSCDLIRVNDQTSLNVYSFGIDTVVLQAALRFQRRIPRLGGFSYVLGLLFSLNKLKSIPIEYELKHADGRISQGETSSPLVAVCNGRHHGSGYTPAPDARIDDGVLDLCLPQDLTFGQFVGLILRYRKGTHIHDPRIAMEKVLSGRFKSMDGQEIEGNIDGIPVAYETVEFEVLPDALNFAYLR